MPVTERHPDRHLSAAIMLSIYSHCSCRCWILTCGRIPAVGLSIGHWQRRGCHLMKQTAPNSEKSIRVSSWCLSFLAFHKTPPLSCSWVDRSGKGFLFPLNFASWVRLGFRFSWLLFRRSESLFLIWGLGWSCAWFLSGGVYGDLMYLKLA